MIKPSTNRLFVTRIEALITDLSSRNKVELYHESIERCPNCKYDPVGKTGSGVYNGTGPQPFDGKQCPVCKNKGEVVTSSKTHIIATIKFGPSKEGDIPGVAGVIPDAHASLKSLYRYHNAIVTAKAVYVDDVRYRKVGQPTSRGLLDKVVSQILIVRDD